MIGTRYKREPRTPALEARAGSRVLCNHTYKTQQIEWFKAGGALNIIRAQQKG